MRITIAERLKPFSHLPGSACMVPGTSLRLTIFPAMITIDDLAGAEAKRIAEARIPVKAPVEGFTVIQDLEKGGVKVFGHTTDGYLCYTCHYDPASGSVTIAPTRQSRIQFAETVVPHQLHPVRGHPARLSLGNHKAQDWALMSRRCAMEEIFPLWHRLGKMTPKVPTQKGQGTLALLQECSDAINRSKPEGIIPAFRNLFITAFDGMLAPEITDIHHQGFPLPPAKDASPLLLLTEGAALIESLFVRLDDAVIAILPALPPELHCGRLTGLQIPGVGRLDFEWSKKTIRRLVLHAEVDGSIRFRFPSDIKGVRLRKGDRDRGTCQPCGEAIQVESGRQYFLDNFTR